MIQPDLLQNLRLFEGIADAQLESLATVADLKDYPAHTLIFREGEKTPYIYAVHEGSVGLDMAVAGRGNVLLHTVGSGELLGWSPLLQLGPMTATARSLTACRLIRLRAPQVLALAEQDPRFGMELMRRTAMALAMRLNATRLHLLDVFRNDLPTVPHRNEPS